MAHTPNVGDRGRFSARRKTDAVLRLLRGEDLDLLSRELGVTAATLSGWRDDFLAGGQAALKSRPADDRDDEIARLRSKVGELCGAGTSVTGCAGTWVTPQRVGWPPKGGAPCPGRSHPCPSNEPPSSMPSAPPA